MASIPQLLTAVIQDSRLHARFLNSLSYLEYRGARKIARALRTEDIDDDVLTHAMEEMGHALCFKKLAIKVGGEEFRLYRSPTLLAEEAIKHYFFALDQGVETMLAGLPNLSISARKRVYYFVTWLIEVRAVAVYRDYQRLLQQFGQSLSLKPILADEAGHLADVESAIAKIQQEVGIDISGLLALESELFLRTWEAMSHAAEPVVQVLPL
jgi:hypothetical protein